jgi:hypothetical protein
MTAQLAPRTPTRRTGWPVLRTPRWMLAGAALLVAGLVLAALPHRPSTGERAADLRGMVHDLTTDIESCAGGVTDSLTALREIVAGTSHDVRTAAKIANYAAGNCSPGNNMQMEDLVQYQVPESLASFHLETAVNDLVTWAFPLAQRVQEDVAALVTEVSPSAVPPAAVPPAVTAAATAQLRRDQRALDAQRAKIDAQFQSASRALGANVSPPPLPS